MSYMSKKRVKTAKHLVLNTVLSLVEEADFQAVRVGFKLNAWTRKTFYKNLL